MEVLAHRGFWGSPEEKNSEAALRRAFASGFGVETDIRDHNGEVVISHDVPVGSPMNLDKFFSIYVEHSSELSVAPLLALNIKADGLQELLAAALAKHGIKNYFVFDMSVPDALGYARHSIDFFTRVSDLEKQPTLYDLAHGIWVDGFEADWEDMGAVEKFLNDEKKVCFVSSELHGRKSFEEKQWPMLKKLNDDGKIMICSDFPKQADRYFNGG